TVPVAVNTAGLPATLVPDTVAVSWFAPATGPSSPDVTAAMPLPPVATGTAGVTIPPPPVTANVTKTPCIGLPTASVTLTDGGLCPLSPAAAFWPSPATFVSLAGAAVRPDALNVTLRLAGAPFPTAAAV